MFGSKKLETIETVVNHELKLVTKWLSLNRLSLNADKTELIFFHSRQRSLNYDISIKFNGVRLIPVNYVKYSGLFIDKYLSWNFHVLQLRMTFSSAMVISCIKRPKLKGLKGKMVKHQYYGKIK